MIITYLGVRKEKSICPGITTEYCEQNLNSGVWCDHPKAFSEL